MAKNETAHSLINVATLATNILSEAAEGSLIDYTAVLRNEPIVMMEDSLVHQAVSSDVLKFLTNLFAGYYLQAVAITNNIGNVNVMQVLDRLNSKRDVLSNAKAEFVSRESFAPRPQFKLTPEISKESAQLMYPAYYRPSVESYDEVSVESTILDNKDNNAPDVNNAAGRDAVKTLNDAPNLATGKIFEVVIENEGKRATIPVSVRLNPLSCSPGLVQEMLSLGDIRNSTIERFRRWREGELEFINDLILCNDLVEKHYSLLKADKHGIYKDILKRRRNNRLSALITQSTSLATASSMCIITEDTASDLQMAIGGKLADPKVRASVFARCSLMFLVVIDPELQFIRIYHRGIAYPMELTYGEIKNQAKGNGPDVMELLKAFSAGNRPNI
jgi:hypothetical protein